MHRLTRWALSLTMIAGCVSILIPSSAGAANAQGTSTIQVLVPENAVQPGDTVTIRDFSRSGQLLSVKTVPAPVDSWLSWHRTSLVRARARHQPYVLVTGASSHAIHQAMNRMTVQLSTSSQQTSLASTAAIACGTQARVTGSFTADGGRVNYAITYKKFAVNCSLDVTNYAMNMNPAPSSTLYLCYFTWNGYQTNPDVVAPNYPTWYNSGAFNWRGGGGYQFVTDTQQGGCNFWNGAVYTGSLVLN